MKQPCDRWLRAAAIGMLSLMAAGCRPERRDVTTTGRVPSNPPARTEDAIDYGCRFAAAMPGDEDAVQTQSKALEQLTQACLQRGAVDRALSVAQKIRGWQRGTACADVAAAFAHAGQTNKAHRALLDAEAWRALLREQTRETSMGWTTGRIRDRIAVARAALGETEMRAEVLRKPLTDVNANTLGTLISYDEHQTNADFLNSLSVATTNKDFAVQQGIGQGVLMWADKQVNLTGHAVDEVVAVVRATLQLQPEPYQLPVKVQLIGFLRHQGRMAEAATCLADLEAMIRKMPGRYYLSSGLADLAVLASEVDTNRTASLIVEAETEAGRCQNASRALALAHVADRACNLGQTETAQRIYLDALTAVTVLPSVVPRLEQLADVCASMGGAGVPLTTALRARLDELARHEESPASSSGQTAITK